MPRYFHTSMMSLGMHSKPSTPMVPITACRFVPSTARAHLGLPLHDNKLFSFAHALGLLVEAKQVDSSGCELRASACVSGVVQR